MADLIDFNKKEFNIHEPEVPRYAYQRYPRVMYHKDPKKGIPIEIDGVEQSHISVANEVEENAAKKQGFGPPIGKKSETLEPVEVEEEPKEESKPKVVASGKK